MIHENVSICAQVIVAIVLSLPTQKQCIATNQVQEFLNSLSTSKGYDKFLNYPKGSEQLSNQ